MNRTLNPPVDLLWRQPARSRRGFADDSARRLYFLEFPLLLLSVGLAAWIVPNDWMLFISALTGAFVGLYTLWEIAIRRKAIRFSHIFCIANTVGYGLGVVNSWLTVSRGDLSLAASFGRDTEAVSRAMGAVLIASAVLYTLGEIYETPIFSQSYRLRLDNRAIVFSLLGTGIIITGYATGQLGYGGLASSGGHISVFMGLLSWLFPSLFAFTALCFLEWRKGIVKRLFGVLLAVQFLMIIPLGRRSIVYFVLLAIIATRFTSFKLRWSIPKKIIYTAAVGAIIVAGATFYFYMRVAGWENQKASLADRISLAMMIYESGNTAKANRSLRENLEKRTFVLGYLSDLLDASSRMQPALGANAFHEFQLAIPSAFWGNKDAYLYQEEDVANATFHTAYIDQANSVYTAGALDFGIWGMILYPVIISALFRLWAGMMKASLPGVISTLVILFLLSNALLTEAGLSTRFLVFRDSTLYAGFLWLLFKIPSFSFVRDTRKEAHSNEMA